MDKVIVEIICPVSAKTYEFRTSKKLSAGDGKKKIISEIRDLEQNEGIFSSESDVLLFSGRLECVLREDISFLENGVKSGDVLMII